MLLRNHYGFSKEPFIKQFLNVPWNALEHAALFCADIVLTETGRQGGTYQAVPPLFKIANSVCLYHSLG